MSGDEAEAFMNRLDKWDAKHARRDFLHKMERKFRRREHGASF